MIIDNTNYSLGYKAMGSILLLYYYLLEENGITNDQTIYIDSNEFDPFSYLNSKINEKGFSLDINQKLLQEGSIIYLLCDLNDMIGEYEDTYLDQDITQKIISAHNKGKLSAIPEVDKLINIINKSELDYESYNLLLSQIYKKYVVAFFSEKLKSKSKS